MKKILITIGIILAVVLFIRFVAGGPEDSWICDSNGNWTKHGSPSYPKPEISCSGTTPLPKNKEDCLNQGGVWEKQGPEPFETCDRKTIDRGNLCRDNDECEGMCQVDLTREEIRQGMSGEIKTGKKFGQCSVWVVKLGCFGMMKHGKVQVICID